VAVESRMDSKTKPTTATGIPVGDNETS